MYGSAWTITGNQKTANLMKERIPELNTQGKQKVSQRDKLLKY
jgi:hypothetical protein